MDLEYNLYDDKKNNKGLSLYDRLDKRRQI